MATLPTAAPGCNTGRSATPATERVHPGPFDTYPPKTPKLEQLPSEYRDYGHTPATWTSFITAPAIVEAHAIYKAAESLSELVSDWIEKHHDEADPGAAAISAAGLPLPVSIADHGTEAKWIRNHMPGLAWCLKSFIDWMDFLPDPDDLQNAPSNVRRLLGLSGQEGS